MKTVFKVIPIFVILILFVKINLAQTNPQDEIQAYKINKSVKLDGNL